MELLGNIPVIQSDAPVERWEPRCWQCEVCSHHQPESIRKIKLIDEESHQHLNICMGCYLSEIECGGTVIVEVRK